MMQAERDLELITKLVASKKVGFVSFMQNQKMTKPVFLLGRSHGLLSRRPYS